MTILFYLFLCLFLILCVLLCLIILVQESKSLGLGATFGVDRSDSLFGTSTADVLKKITASFALFFMLGSVILSIWTNALDRAKNKNHVEYVEETDKV